MAPDQSRMGSIHAAQVCLGIRVDEAQPRVMPAASQMDPQMAVLGECVPDPVRTESIFHDDDEPAGVIEVSHGNAATLARTAA